MKKIKLFLFAAMIIGAASAFKTAKPMSDDLWVPDTDGQGILLSVGQEKGGNCDNRIEESCYYTDQALTTPAPGSPMGRFVYP